MNFALQILNGPLKGRQLSLRRDFVFSSSYFSDEEMSTDHAVLDVDHDFSWNIKGLKSNRVRLGSRETPQATLFKGLVFHLGQTGFKVIEVPPLTFADRDEALLFWLKSQSWEQKTTDFFFFLTPLRLTFRHGPQADEFFTISYGPRELGFNNLDLNIKDPSQPHKILRFYQTGDRPYVENLAGDKVLVNKALFHHHALLDGDQISFGMNQIEISSVR
jgi:hypothetical protein